MRTAYDTYNSGGFEVISVSIREDNAAVDEFITKYDLDYRFLMDRSGEVSKLYGVVETPTTFFIAPDGTIVDSAEGVVDPTWLERNIADHIAA